ncbi:unnamed protein product [Spirodela intermedia]|uniref:Uncharacterized protein n=1 Tax=Spirodela intermedia TaxID=51605 RepID=A0A7I8LIC7_SPIIN|nr:unnamed protein product [Spirodela intermedia]
MAGLNSQMTILSLERNAFPCVVPCPGVFSARRSPVSRRPIFGVVLKVRFLNEDRSVGSLTAHRGVTTATGGAGERSISETVLEKEVRFTPAFGDYVKVLESIQTDRSKNVSGDSDDDLSDSKWRSRGEDGPREARNRDSRQLVGPRESFRSSNGASPDRRRQNYLDSRRLTSPKGHMGAANVRSDNFHRTGTGMSREDGREVLLEKRTGRMGAARSGGSDSRSGSSGLRSSNIGGQNNKHLEKRRLSAQDDVSSREKDPKQKGRHGGNGSLGRPRPGEERTGAQKDERQYFTQLKDHSGRDNSPRRTYERSKELQLAGPPGVLAVGSANMRDSPKWNGRIALNNTNEEIRDQGHTHSKVSKIDGRGHISDDDVDDRTAFKTFEVFTDVRNRPRVLRMELEQRIQDLAKWLNATDVNMPEWRFSRMMYSAKIKFTDHSILRVVQILGTHGNWRRVLQVVEWLQLRQPFESYKSRYIYTTVLSVLGKAKRPVEALNVFYSMRKELSSYPDLAAYHCIAVILGQAGMMKELFDVIDCMRSIPEKKFRLGMLQKWDPRLEPDLVVFNAVLNACVQQKQWEGAFWVLQELKVRGIKPTNTTYGLAMEVMLVCGRYNLVHEFFKKVQKSSVPGALNYKVLVNTFWREGKVDEAVLAVKDMERRGIVGSASLYYDLARCLCSAGRCQEALQLIDKLCKVAQKPLVVTYTGLIQACLDSGSIENATYVFNQMHNFCTPNVVTCNIMLKSYVERGMFQEAKNLFKMILEGNKLICKKSDLRGKVIPDRFTFNTMLEACANTENWDDFEYVYEKMLEYEHHFNARRHLRMVMDASRAGKVRLVDVTYHHLIQSGRTPPPAILTGRPSPAAT